MNDTTKLSVEWIAPAAAKADHELETASRERLAPLLQPGEGLAEWRERRDTLRRAWMGVLGAMPERCELDTKVLREERLRDHVRYLIRYETEPGCRVEAFLLLPCAAANPGEWRERLPGAVVFHATSSNHILQPVGLADAPTRHLAVHLARRGYVVLCPRCYIYGHKDDAWPGDSWIRPRGAGDFASATQLLLRDHPGWTGMGKMLWDGMRAVDVLASHPAVDGRRIVALGHSLGAKEALYLEAFDERVRAAVASEGGVGIPQSNWDAPWYLGRQARSPQFGRDHHELLALMAPRSFLLIGGGESDGPRSRAWVDPARIIYSLYNKTEDLAFLLHNGGHDFPDAVRDEALDWLDRSIGVARPADGVDLSTPS